MGNEAEIIRTRVCVEVQLPCGCWVSQTLATRGTIDGIERTLKLAADVLPHHFDKTELAHKCELMDESNNPNGESRAN